MSSFHAKAPRPNRQSCATPVRVLEELKAEFELGDYDPCPNSGDSQPKMNGLKIDWGSEGERIFVNPPYGDCKSWVTKAIEQCTQRKCFIVMLLPTWVYTRWWHELVQPNASCVRFLCGRLKFPPHKTQASFGSVVVVFDPQKLGMWYRLMEQCGGV